MFRHYHACGQGCPGARCRDRVWRDPSAVRPKPGAEVTQEALVAFCRGQLASFKIPRYTVMLEAFPMTSSGKVQKCKEPSQNNFSKSTLLLYDPWRESPCFAREYLGAVVRYRFPLGIDTRPF
jgi:hypothetical protein